MSLHDELKVFAEAHPEMRKSLVPMLRRAAAKPLKWSVDYREIMGRIMATFPVVESGGRWTVQDPDGGHTLTTGSKAKAVEQGVEWFTHKLHQMSESYKRASHTASNSFMGVQTRPFGERLEGVKNGWWSDIEKLFTEWWSFDKVVTRRNRGQLRIVNETKGITVTLKGTPLKFQVWANNRERAFDSTANLYDDVLLWVQSVLDTKV